MARGIQHGAAALGAGLQATGPASNLAEATGAWRYGKRSAFSTSPHPRRRLRTIVQRGVTLTFHLVQKTGQVTGAVTAFGVVVRIEQDLTPNLRIGCRVLGEIAYPTTAPDLQEIHYLHPGLLGDGQRNKQGDGITGRIPPSDRDCSANRSQLATPLFQTCIEEPPRERPKSQRSDYSRSSS